MVEGRPITVISWIASSVKTLPSVTSAVYVLSIVISIQLVLMAAKSMGDGARGVFELDGDGGQGVLGIDHDAMGPIVLLEPGRIIDVGPVDAGHGHRLPEGEPDHHVVAFGQVFDGDLILASDPEIRLSQTKEPMPGGSHSTEIGSIGASSWTESARSSWRR